MAGVVLLGLFVGWQHLQRGEPLMPLSLFAGRDFAAGNGIGFVFQLGMIGIALVLVLYLQAHADTHPCRPGWSCCPAPSSPRSARPGPAGSRTRSAAGTSSWRA
ncbi:hypothetical protein [Nonomuraea rosea]|uniref:hypothetical protein n=1 Tax=Nonomuraea rosea TaxID=638574 RepID=UPI0031EF0B87